MKKVLVVLMALSLIVGATAATEAAQKIKGTKVTYTAQGVEMIGYLAYDANIAGKRPGVLVVHEWWGLNDYARKRARMLAELGYAALAVDMYGGNRLAAHPDDAGKFSSEVTQNLDMAKARFVAAMDFLKRQPFVDPTRIAAIGYCFGGGVVLNMAGQGLDLKGVASFHGSLSAVKAPAQGAVKAKLLVLNGADDKFIKPEQIQSFKDEMKGAGADLKFINYPGALHSFTNPEADALGKKFNLPLAYNAAADKQSWNELKGFLKEVFAK